MRNEKNLQTKQVIITIVQTVARNVYHQICHNSVKDFQFPFNETNSHTADFSLLLSHGLFRNKYSSSIDIFWIEDGFKWISAIRTLIIWRVLLQKIISYISNQMPCNVYNIRCFSIHNILGANSKKKTQISFQQKCIIRRQKRKCAILEQYNRDVRSLKNSRKLWSTTNNMWFI